MQWWVFRLNKTILNNLALLFVIFCLSGCVESSFQLSESSRFPKWFNSTTIKHDNYSVRIDLHSTFSGSKNVIKLYEKGSIFPLKKITITSDTQPSILCRELKEHPEGFPKGYPCYIVMTINGITDVIELQRMEPYFYMTDDKNVWEELGVSNHPTNSTSQ